MDIVFPCLLPDISVMLDLKQCDPNLSPFSLWLFIFFFFCFLFLLAFLINYYSQNDCYSTIMELLQYYYRYAIVLINTFVLLQYWL